MQMGNMTRKNKPKIFCQCEKQKRQDKWTKKQEKVIAQIGMKNEVENKYRTH